MSGMFSIQRTVNFTLQVFNTRTNRKRLRLKEYALSMQRKEGVSRTVTESKNSVFAGDALIFCIDCTEHVSLLTKAGHCGSEVDFTAPGDDLFTHIADNLL